MKVRLNRCLFIGLGGTGVNSILKTKENYQKMLAEVPPIIGFLGLDAPTEVSRIEDLLRSMTWMSSRNRGPILYRECNQLRATGRFLF